MKVLILFVGLFGLVIGAPKDCSSAEGAKADVCVANINIVGYRGAKFPVEASGVGNYCANATEGIKCVKDYSRKCNSAFPKQITHMVLLGANRVVKKYCKDPSKYSDLSEHGKCANTGLEAAHVCMETYIDDIQGSMKGENDFKIPINCCAFNKFRKCVVGVYKAVGPASCPQKSLTFIDSFIDDLARDALDLICSDFKDAPTKCDPIAIPTKDAGVKRTTSFYLPLVEVFASLA